MDDFLSPINKLQKELYNIGPIKNPQFESIEQNLASEFCKKLHAQVTEFDSRLDNDKQVALRLVSFGQTVTFTVTAIGYSNPSLIRFFGILPDGSPVELIQHVSQISFLLTSSTRDDQGPKKPIGFRNE